MSCGRGNGELTGKPKYHAPHEYGVDPGQARNLRLNSSGVAIGAWHNLPRSLYLEHVRDGVVPDAVYEQALVEYPTVVYLHGNALNRAAPFRVRSYQEISEVLNANVIAIDYRGFGDSESFPTEEGVVLDARAAVQFVLDHARRPDRTGPAPGLTLMGQSLGTGVAAQCALRLVREGIHVDGVVLLAAFSSLRPLVAAFRMGGVVPLLGWLDYVPLMKFSYDWTPAVPYAALGYQMFAYLFEWTDTHWLPRRKPKMFRFTPHPISSAGMYWWAGPEGFCASGCIFAIHDKPWFDERFPPLSLYCGEQDQIVLFQPLLERIAKHEPSLRVIRTQVQPDAEHCDHYWAADAVEWCFYDIFGTYIRTRAR